MVSAAGLRPLVAPLLLVVAVVAAYAPSLGGGFLNYDDPWLIRDNPVLREASPAALATIWTDFGEQTRLALGAEYLPVRDTTEWLEARMHALDPRAMRALNLALFAAAALFLRGFLRRVVPDALVAEGAAFLFALHPVHVESVAWLAGRKDVLALLFVAAAFHAHAGVGRHRFWSVPVLVFFAVLSKGVAVVAPVLLPLGDRLQDRRVDLRLVLPALAVALAALAIHSHVGGVVEMTTAPLGGGPPGAMATMGPILLRYLGSAFFPAHLSVVYEVPIRRAADLFAWAAYLPLAAWLAAGIWLWRSHGQRLPLAAWVWFLVPLAPTSHVLWPLQNLMADRYLLLGVLGPCVLASLILAQAPRRLAIAALVLVSGAFLWIAAGRAVVFSDSVLLWTDALRKTPESAVASYQLGMALKESGRTREAQALLAEALRRSAGQDERGRRAANNLSVLLVRQGRLADAETLLRAQIARTPDDPKLLNNLAEVLARLGRHAEARAVLADLIRRFPDYEIGLRNYERRYGSAR